MRSFVNVLSGKKVNCIFNFDKFLKSKDQKCVADSRETELGFVSNCSAIKSSRTGE